jgi:outer membrane receptor protein involved in Fe transport
MYRISGAAAIAHPLAAVVAVLLLSAGLLEARDSAPVTSSLQEETETSDSDEPEKEEQEANEQESLRLAAKANLQPAPALPPQQQVVPAAPAPSASSTTPLVARSLLGQNSGSARLGPASTTLSAGEGVVRSATDVGSFLGRSSGAIGIGVQRRSPIVNDPRMHGNRVGELVASGSYWVPARIDLDTAVSKLDTTMIDEVTVIKGPYSVLYGPGRNFIDMDLARSPRYEQGWETHSSSGAEYKTNGEQLMGKAILQGGNATQGYRAGYVHRTGNDYQAGNGIAIPASYNSRELDFALGRDFGDDNHFEFNYLRLDQTGVELAGQAFDIDYLITDGFSLEYEIEHGHFSDHATLEVWYNDTRFTGNAQSVSKRQIFPVLDLLQYVGNTDVTSQSIGYSYAMSWGYVEECELTLGTDLRVVTQELNEIASGINGLNQFQNANSPIPKSESLNPGVFLAWQSQVQERLKLQGGVRGDWVHTEIKEDPAGLQNLGNYLNVAGNDLQPTFAEIVGTDQWIQNFSLISGFLSAEQELDDNWTLVSGAGVGRRPPSLTELYAAQPFMFLLQNGLNTVTGDPRLKDETFTQLDLGLRLDSDRWRGGINGYHSWAVNYITFESLSYNILADQLSLQYVNTDLATFAGCEGYLEYDVNEHLTPFMTFTYVDGKDRTRNGDFATRAVDSQDPQVASFRDPTMVRGAFSGITGGAEEPLPGISPFETRLGLRLHSAGNDDDSIPDRWGAEIGARIVDNQDRVAVSLLEQPTAGFTIWDLRMYWRPRDKALLYASLENLGNRTYREHLDYRSRIVGLPSIFQPGINFAIGGQLEF